MSMKLSLREALERAAASKDEPLAPLDSVAPNVWIKPIDIPHIVALAKAMVGLGLRLKYAHEAINRLAASETIAIAIPGEVGAIAAALEPYGVIVTAYEQEPAVAMAGLREPDRNIR
ncbi:MAG: hypothetical protein H7312_26070 [Tardiphaga sp.]|nr:hypothetical protein [Tardiphaga sp.]